MAKPKTDEVDKLAADKVRETFGALSLDQAREVVLAQIAADEAAAEAEAKAAESKKTKEPKDPKEPK